MSYSNQKIFGAAILGLFFLTLIGFRGVLENNFVLNWDDFDYITENPMIQDWDHSAEMLTSFHAANWHPLTWFSHALDYQLYGLEPWGHHLTSLVLHGLNTCWVFVLFVLLADPYRKNKVFDLSLIAGGVFTSLLFGLHPLRVESVAWVSERKDLLCGFFFLSSIAVYWRYVQEKSRNWYFFLVLLLILALMSKPMAVTLPVVLLLLDIFPFARLRGLTDLLKLFKEKLPLFLLSFGGGILTIMAQGSTGAIRDLSETSLVDRICNAFYALWFYLQKTLWPRDLLPFYSLQKSSLGSDFAQGLIIFLVVTLFCVHQMRKGNFIWVVAWLFYLTTVAPVIGLVKVGTQAMADRYTYIPLLGPVFLAGAGVMRLWRTRTYQVVVFIATVLMVFNLSVSSSSQIKIWKNGKSLWVSVAEAYPGEVYRAHANLAIHYYQAGEIKKSEEQLQIAKKIQPEHPDNFVILGMIYTSQGKLKEAERILQKAISLKPDNAKIFYRLGVVYEKARQWSLAEANYGKALNLESDQDLVRIRLGQLYSKTGRPQKAEDQFNVVLDLNPDSEDARINLGALYFQTGRLPMAEVEYKRVITTWPRKVRAYNNLGVLYYETQKLKEAEKVFLQVLQMEPNQIEATRNLGVVYLEMKKIDEALKLIKSAKALDSNRVETIFYLGMAYMAHKNWRLAEAEFKDALALNPDNSEVFNQLGVLYARQKKWTEALQAFEYALQLNAEHGSAKRNLKSLKKMMVVEGQ